MKLYNVAILGATGAVGREMMKILQERSFPIAKLKLLASARSVGKQLPFGDEMLTVEEACESAFEGVDIVLGAAQADIARKMAPAIVKAGAVFVDNSSAFRMNDDVPLIVPEINPEDVKAHHGIISNPNCSTIITVTAVAGYDTPAILKQACAQIVGNALAGPLGVKEEHAGQVGITYANAGAGVTMTSAVCACLAPYRVEEVA